MKTNLLVYAVILIATLFLEIGVLARFFGGYYLSIVVPLIFFGFLLFPIEQMLIIGATAGLILDMAYLSRSIASMIFLLFELVILRFLSKVFVNLRSSIGVFLALLALEWVYSLTRLILDHALALSFQIAYVAIAGIVLSVLLFLVYQLLRKAGIWQKE